MISIHVVDAFTDKIGTGNRAGVVLDADNLSEVEMQEIAAFAGFSETAFVLKAEADDHDLRVRYFTPNTEVPICGHATIATHFIRSKYFGSQSYPLNVLTGVGVLPVSLSKNNDGLLMVHMRQGTAIYGHTLSGSELNLLAEALGISTKDFDESLPVQIVSTGHGKVMVPLKRRELLNALNPKATALVSLSQRISCNGFFPFVIEQVGNKLQTHGRMFAPASGVHEDPVTGNANAPLGAYLAHYKKLSVEGTATFEAHQGEAMAKPGTVYVTVERHSQHYDVSIAGHAIVAGELRYK